MEFLRALEGLPFSEWITQSDLGYPIMLSFHSIGLAAVVGITAMMDVRVLGFAKGVPLSGFARMTPVAVAGFWVNAISGVLLFMADATRLIDNWAFGVKMLCVVVGGAMFWLHFRQLGLARYSAVEVGEATEAEPLVTRSVRIVAVVSLIAWLVAIDGGRLIAYVIDAAELGV